MSIRNILERVYDINSGYYSQPSMSYNFLNMEKYKEKRMKEALSEIKQELIEEVEKKQSNHDGGYIMMDDLIKVLEEKLK